MSDKSLQFRLERLARHPSKPERDLSLAFLPAQFKQQVAKPYKQLGKVAAQWDRLLPEELARHTRLESLTRGVLRVAVDSSARLYQLDRLLRDGLQQQLVTQAAGSRIHRIQLRVDRV